MPQDQPATDAGTDERPTRETPDSWAPVNRREMRDDVDRFRNLRMPVPANREEARQLLALSLEYYEHAQEVATRTAITLDMLAVEAMQESVRGLHTGEEVKAADVAAEHRNRIQRKNLEAVKELEVAHERHRTALAYLNSFKGE